MSPMKHRCRFLLPVLLMLTASAVEAIAAGDEGPKRLHKIETLPHGAVRSGNTALLIDKDQRGITALLNLSSNTNWLQQSSPLLEVRSAAKLEYGLRATPLDVDAVQLRLRIANRSSEPARVAVTFPMLKGLSPGGDAKQLGYCFPRSGAAIGTTPVKLSAAYGGRFPLQFLDVYHPAAGGICVMTQDTGNQQKTFHLTKRDTIDLSVEYPARTLEPGQIWELPPAVIIAHGGDWHEGLAAYREWLKTWRQPKTPRKRWFLEAFNLRQHFLHFNLGTPGAFDEETKQYHLADLLQQDNRAFGGVDYVHLFDWSSHPKRGRVGDYEPWDFLGGCEPFRHQVGQMQAGGAHVGLYLEGYLLSPESKVAQANGKAWQMLDAQGKPYARMGHYVYPCPHDKRWRQYLTKACVRAIDQTGADGIYIDEFGFGWQYPCHRADHDHGVPSSQIAGEARLLAELRAALPARVVLYVEETPNDYTTQFLDGSFTYAISQSRNDLNPPRINLTRFALPDVKLFEIIRCDVPLGDDLEAVRHVFFNGEGIWLEGPLSKPEWFPSKVRALIARCHKILRSHREAFCSLDPVPLTPTLKSSVWANKFPAKEETVWTLFNVASQPAAGELLQVAHFPGAEYFDVWNERRLVPRIDGRRAYLSLSIGPRDVGCIVQRLPLAVQ